MKLFGKGGIFSTRIEEVKEALDMVKKSKESGAEEKKRMKEYVSRLPSGTGYINLKVKCPYCLLHNLQYPNDTRRSFSTGSDSEFILHCKNATSSHVQDVARIAAVFDVLYIDAIKKKYEETVSAFLQD